MLFHRYHGYATVLCYITVQLRLLLTHYSLSLECYNFKMMLHLNNLLPYNDAAFKQLSAGLVYLGKAPL